MLLTRLLKCVGQFKYCFWSPSRKYGPPGRISLQKQRLLWPFFVSFGSVVSLNSSYNSFIKFNLMWLYAIARKKKEKQKMYVHGLFYINKSNNNYCNKISITGYVMLKLLLININIVYIFTNSFNIWIQLHYFITIEIL